MKLNCKPGDLAITIKCDVPDNLGKIVQIIAYEGLQEWPHFSEPIPVWLIRAYSGHQSLSYLYPDGTLKKSSGGLAPDCFLRPIQGLELEDEVPDTENAPIKENTKC